MLRLSVMLGVRSSSQMNPRSYHQSFLKSHTMPSSRQHLGGGFDLQASNLQNQARKLNSNKLNGFIQLYMELLIQKVIVCKAHYLSMCSMGSGGMPSGKFSKVKCNEIESRGNFKMIASTLTWGSCPRKI